MTVAISLGTLVDRTLTALQGPESEPAFTRINGTVTTSGDISTFLVDDPDNISVSNWLQVGAETMLVTAKSADTDPIITVQRGYYRSTTETLANDNLVHINPRYPRVRVAEAIKRCFNRLESLGLPLVETTTITRETDLKYAEVPANTRDVLRIFYLGTDGHPLNIDGWEYIDAGESISTTGKLVRLPRYVANADTLYMQYRVPYRWASYPDEPNETDEVSMIEGTEDLPVLYAVAWLLGGREIQRQEADVSTEWNEAEPSRNGASISLLRFRWQEFYQAVDLARRLVPAMPLHRPYRKMPRLTR